MSRAYYIKGLQLAMVGNVKADTHWLMENLRKLSSSPNKLGYEFVWGQTVSGCSEVLNDQNYHFYITRRCERYTSSRSLPERRSTPNPNFVGGNPMFSWRETEEILSLLAEKLPCFLVLLNQSFVVTIREDCDFFIVDI